jgi:hypothetical protein
MPDEINGFGIGKGAWYASKRETSCPNLRKIVTTNNIMYV